MPRAEKNTYNLPSGEPIRKALVKVFRAQRKAVLAALRGDGAKADVPGLPLLPDLRLGQLAESGRMTPLLEVYWDAAGRELLSRVDLDPDRWRVSDPAVREAIEGQALTFCRSTNAATSLALAEAREATRLELIAGVVTRGESVAALTKRVNAIFDGAETWRARRIAQTEASRAVHAGQELSAARSGVVAGWEWLLSADACPLCQTVGRRAKFVRLGQPFAVVGADPDYAAIRFPPLHPHCGCTCVEVLKPEFGGDPEPAWADTLVQPVPEARDRPDDAKHLERTMRRRRKRVA